ncbi:unnamed protein product, partial [Discosporangium mesarthrocarpum]
MPRPPPSSQMTDQSFPQVDVDGSGKVDGQESARLLLKSGVPRDRLSKVWEMADQDMDGELTPSEWATAMHLIRWDKCCITRK